MSMILGAFVALAALTLSPSAHSGHHRHHRPPAVASMPDTDPNTLYSLRARRRMVTYLQLRLLELRKAHLDRAAAAIERRLPISELLSGP